MGEKEPTPQKPEFIPSIRIEGDDARVSITDLMRATRKEDVYNMFSQHSKQRPDIPIHIVIDHPGTKWVFREPWVVSKGKIPSTRTVLLNRNVNPILGIRVENVHASSGKSESETLYPQKGTEIVVWARHDTAPATSLTFHRVIAPKSNSK